MAVRGRPPSPHEVNLVHVSPATLSGVIHRWRNDPDLAQTVRDLHAEILLVRTDAEFIPPSIGALQGFPPAQVASELAEAPLRLIEHVVLSGQPYTEILTTEAVLATPLVGAAYGPPVDPEDPSWQVSRWPDGRPAAGILSSTTLWNRHMSANTSFHRSRAALIVSGLVCDDLSQRAEAGTLDPARAEDAVKTDPTCVACHAVLDPVAGAMWGFQRYVVPHEIRSAHAVGCDGPDAPFGCYPLQFWDPTLIADRAPAGLPPPAWYGQPVLDLAALGQAIADDPRFADCTARRFWGYLTRTDPAEVPEDLVIELSDVLIDSGWDAQTLMLTIAAHPRFAPGSPDAPAVAIRPRQAERTLHHLTGATWDAQVGDHGSIPLATTDRYGFRTLLGGLDGWDIVRSEPGALPTRELALEWMAEEAADVGVDTDLLPDGPVTDEKAARTALARLHLVILAEVVDPKSATVDRDWALLQTLLADSPPRLAWRGVLAAFLQHPRLAVQ